MPEPRSDNSADLTQFDRRYRPALMSFFARRVRDRAEAEDLTQEVLARLATGGARAVLHPDAYVFQTASNLLRDRKRRAQVRDDYRTAVEATQLEHSDALAPERVVAARQTLGQAMAALQELSERTRAIFILHRLEKLKKAEIAQMFGLSISGIDKHLLKAMLHLHERLKDEPWSQS